MKLKLNRTLRAALIAAITAVGFTLTSAQAADVTLANVMNQKADTPIIWGENGLDLTSVTASCTTAGVRTNNAYENSFRAVDTNVGNGATWTYTLNFTTGADTNATLSSVTADLLTFNGQNNPHNATNYVNVDWTLSGGGQDLSGSRNNAELTFRSTATAGTAAYASDGQGGYVTSDQSHYCGGTVKFDFDDFALASETTYTLTVAVSRVTQTGFFVGIGNVALNHTIISPSSTWQGTEGNNNWTTSSGAWTPAFVNGNEVVFGTDASCKTVVLSEAVETAKVTVEDDYTIDIQTGGSMSVGSDGIVISADKTLSLKNGNASALALGTVTGEGNIALSAGTFSLSAAPTTAKLLVNGGTLELGGASYTLPTFEISNGGVVTTTRNDGTGCVTGDIHILAGGTFKVIGGHDAFGYNGGQTDTIIMEGTEDHIATLLLNQNNQSSVTMQTNIQMKGYSSISTTKEGGSQGFNTYGGSISAENASNTIARIELRKDLNVEVKDGGSLDIAQMVQSGTSDGTRVLTKAGKGILIFSGEANMNKLVHNAGTVEFAGGTSTVNGLNLASDATLRISGTGTVVNIGGDNSTISSTIQVDAGTLNLTGTFAIDAIPSDMQVSWSGAADANNGFKTSTGEIQVYNATNGGTVTIADGAHITYGGTDVKGSMNNGVYSVQGETDYSNFYVNTAGTTELVSKAYSDSHTPDKFTLAANTGLKVDMTVAATVTGSGDSSVVTIESDRVLTGTAQNVKIAGSGTYALTSGSTSIGANVSLDAGWSGTVRLGGFGFKDTDLAPFMNGSKTSWVEMNGITGGYLKAWNGGTEAANIRLTNPGDDGIAWKWSDGTSGTSEPTITFTGKWEGEGTFQVSNLRQNFTFSGDISKWNGTFDYHGNHGTTLTFKGDATEINATILNNGVNDTAGTQKQFHMVVQNEASFGQDVAAYTLDVAEGASATFKGDATFNSLSGTGKVALDEDSTLTVSGTVAESVKIDAADGATIDADLDTTQVGIAANATASFVQGVADVASGVSFQNEGETPAPVTVENTSANEVLHYNIGAENAKVTADNLTGFAQDAVTVKNEVVVGEILNYGEGCLTLTNVDTAALQSIGAHEGDITLQNVGQEPIELKDMTLLTTTVAVYQGTEEAVTEGTVTITDTLFAGGSTLLANLTIIANEQGTTTWTLMDNAMTLGSTLALDTEKGSRLIQLDETTMTAIAAMTEGQEKALVLNGADAIIYEGGDWWDNVFSREYGDGLTLTGDYKVGVLSNGDWGVTKFSNVPEPTTGTLSLLALAALAARRRRK